MKTEFQYSSDSTNRQWQLIRQLLPPRSGRGRPSIDRRRVINAILYVVRIGCQWRMLPKNFPNWSTVQTVLRPIGIKGFVVLPKRWIVERTFAWLARHRRHSKVYERTKASSEAITYIAMMSLMSKRLATAENRISKHVLRDCFLKAYPRIPAMLSVDQANEKCSIAR